jgi:beta-glucosidase
MNPLALLTAAAAIAFAMQAQAQPSAVATPQAWPRAASPAQITDPATEAFISRLMQRMTLQEKVGQTIQADIGSITPGDLRRYPIGALLAGGNSGPYGDDRAPAARWVSAIKAYRDAAASWHHGHAAIPLLFGIDAVHGNNNIPGATIFPHNIGLGAARDPGLVGRIGAATAAEVAAIGADWTFGPTLAVPQDVRWGRSYEGFSENPEIVRSYAGPITLGLQGPLKSGQPIAPDHVIGAAKHFVADGGTANGIDQGDARIDEASLVRIHAQGYPAAIDAGVLSVMVSFSAWNGVRDIANRSLLTEILKQRLGFAGFVVGDWNAHGKVPGCTDTACPQAMNAGLDMFMAPDSWKDLLANTIAQVQSGAIPIARLDDAVRRILRVKAKAGLFANTRTQTGHLEWLGAPAHRALARRAVRESLVLLKNDGVLPISPAARVLVAGDGADSIAKQCGGWTISWQGTGNRNSDFPQGESAYAGLAAALAAAGGHAERAPDGRFTTRPDVAVVVFGEDPYAEFQGDITSLEYQPGAKSDLALLRRLRAQHIPVVAVFLSGRPLWTNPEINAADAFVAAWLPGTEGGGIADLLIAAAPGHPRYDFTGRLSFSWPNTPAPPALHPGDPGAAPLFAYGYGLSYAHPGRVKRLSETGQAASAPPDADHYFADGHAGRTWTLSARGAATLSAVDAGAQENARRARWAGTADGAVSIAGGPVDLTRQATGDMTLTLEYRIDLPPSRTVSLDLACGAGCGASLDVTPSLKAAPRGAWRTLSVRLSCFAAAGARLDQVTVPFALTTQGQLDITFRMIGLVQDAGGGRCPQG